MSTESLDLSPDSSMSRRGFLGALGATLFTAACGTTVVRGHASPAAKLFPELPGSIPAALNPAELTATPVLGIDTSHWQEDGKSIDSALLDIQKFKAHGGSFQISKASQGLASRSHHHRDQTFKTYRQHAADQDLLFGAYGFLDAGSGDKQAEQHLEEVSNSGPLEGIMYCLDVEDNGSGNLSGPSYDDVLAYVETFYKYVHSARLIIYTAQYYWGGENPDGTLHHGVLGNPPAPHNTELWAAEYIPGNRAITLGEIAAGAARPETPEDPWILKGSIGTWPYPAIRQAGSNGKEQQFQGQPTADGNSRRVLDIDVSFYPLAKLKQLAGL